MPLIDTGVEWDEAEKEAEYKVLPTADYQVQVMSWDMETTKEGGHPMIAWTLNVVNNPDPDLNGKPLWTRTPTQGKGRPFLTRFCQACKKPWVGSQIDPDEYVGCVMLASVEETEYNGKPSNQINALSAL